MKKRSLPQSLQVEKIEWFGKKFILFKYVLLCLSGTIKNSTIVVIEITKGLRTRTKIFEGV